MNCCVIEKVYLDLEND